MTECFNTEFKEKLPELAAGTLEDPVQVEGHVATCPHCAAELEIIRAVRESAVPAPFINVAKIVRALPPAPVPVREERPWYRRASLQMAAAFLLVAGGVYSVREAGDRVAASSEVAIANAPVGQDALAAPSAPVVAPPAVTDLGEASGAAPARIAAPARSDIALVTGLDELSTQELTALLNDVDALAAVPVDEPVEFTPVTVNEAQGEG